jgi:hypothetical protein
MDCWKAGNTMQVKLPGLISQLPNLCNAYGFLITNLFRSTLMFGIIKREFGNCQLSKLTINQTDGMKDQLTIQELPNGIDLFLTIIYHKFIQPANIFLLFHKCKRLNFKIWSEVK